MPTHFTGSRAEMRTLNTFIKLTRCTNSLLTRLAERGQIEAANARAEARDGRRTVRNRSDGRNQPAEPRKVRMIATR